MNFQAMQGKTRQNMIKRHEMERVKFLYRTKKGTQKEE